MEEPRIFLGGELEEIIECYKLRKSRLESPFTRAGTRLDLLTELYFWDSRVDIAIRIFRGYVTRTTQDFRDRGIVQVDAQQLRRWQTDLIYRFETIVGDFRKVIRMASDTMFDWCHNECTARKLNWMQGHIAYQTGRCILKLERLYDLPLSKRYFEYLDGFIFPRTITRRVLIDQPPRTG